MARLDDRTPGYRPNPTEAQAFHGVIMCIAATGSVYLPAAHHVREQPQEFLRNSDAYY